MELISIVSAGDRIARVTKENNMFIVEKKAINGRVLKAEAFYSAMQAIEEAHAWIANYQH